MNYYATDFLSRKTVGEGRAQHGKLISSSMSHLRPLFLRFEGTNKGRKEESMSWLGLIKAAPFVARMQHTHKGRGHERPARPAAAAPAPALVTLISSHQRIIAF